MIVDALIATGLFLVAERLTRRPPPPAALASAFLNSHPSGALWVQPLAAA